MADLTQDLQVSLSWGSIAESFHSLRSLSVRPRISFNLYVQGCLDCTVGAFHVSIPAEPSLFQYEVQVFNAEPCKELSGPDGGSVLWFNIADQSDHCSVILLQMLEAGLCWWPSFTGMEHCTLHTQAVHTATCLKRKLVGRENWFQLLELLPGGFHTCCGWKLTTTGCWEHVS